MAREGADARHDMQDTLEKQDDQLRAIRNDVHVIKESLAGYKGFVGGMVFIVTAFGGAIGAALMALYYKLTGSP